jgi:ribosomal protein L37AE/L43A
MPLHFTQSCPTCGRRLQVHTRLLGQNVACQHCHGQFTAGASEDASRHDSSHDLLARAEAMLKLTETHGRPETPTATGV